LLSEDSYLLEGLQSAVRTKTHPKPKLQNAPIFTGNGRKPLSCFTFGNKNKNILTSCVNDNQPIPTY